MTSPSDQCNPIAETLKDWAAEFNRKLPTLLPPTDDTPPELVEAMHYALLAGGKRLRPYLVMRCCEIIGGTADDALPAAVAIECIHTFSLVHDDLPAMDNDDLRRGRPTTHRTFGEAMAILAGDALLTIAFEIIARHARHPERSARMMLELARGTGCSGMIGGQVQDIVSQHAPPSPETTQSIHAKKTAALFETACRLGALAANANQRNVDRVSRYGRHLGLAFQIADDLLDVTATTNDMGKNVGKDIDAGKQSYPAVFGLDASRRAAAKHVERAISAIEPLGLPAEDLRALAMFVVQRHH